MFQKDKKRYKYIVVYHNSCADGLTSAALFKIWLTKYHYDDMHNYIFVPGEYHKVYEDYNNDGIDFTDSTIFFLDFSFKKDCFKKLLDVSNTIILLDHHKSALDELSEFFESNKIINHFDMNECGSSLTWKYLYPDTPIPCIINHIKDRDIWLWSDENSEDFCFYIDSKELTLKTYTKFYMTMFSLPSDSFSKAYQSQLFAGKAISNTKKQESENIIKNGKVIDFVYPNTLLVNANYSHLTWLSKLALDSGLYESMIVYHFTKDGCKCSIRTRNDRSSITLGKAISGRSGGHVQASGGLIKPEDYCTHPLIKLIIS